MDLNIGDKVNLIVGRKTNLGFTVLVNEEFEGMLYLNELYQKIAEGDQLEGYVKKIRDDGKIDVSLQPLGFKKTIITNETKILEALAIENGFLPLHDKSTPETIKFSLGMSKKAFKSAIGVLYKQRKIVILPNGIQLKN